MATYTLEVTDVPEELLQLLDLRVQHQAKDRSAYIRDLLRQNLKNTQPPEENRAKAAENMAEVLAPFHEAIQASGSTEAEAIGIFDEALREARAERRGKLGADTSRML